MTKQTPQWVILHQGSGPKNEWWNIVRENDYFAEGQLGRPWGNFIAAEWAQATADRVNALEAKVTSLEEAIREAEVWRDVIEDMAVNSWTYRGDGDAQKEIHGIVAQAIREQLDPVISLVAAKATLADRAYEGNTFDRLGAKWTWGDWKQWMADYEAMNQPDA